MKKSVFTLLALAITSASVFTSCDKSNDGYEAPSTKLESNVSTDDNTQRYNCFAYFINDEMASYGTWTVTVTDGSKTSEYDIVAQGKHGTYTLNTESEMQNVPGYYFSFAQPVSDNKVKATVKFTPNEKAQSLTKDDMLNSKFGFSKFVSTSADTQANGRLYGIYLKDSQGDHILEAYNSACTFMTGK